MRQGERLVLTYEATADGSMRYYHQAPYAEGKPSDHKTRRTGWRAVTYCDKAARQPTWRLASPDEMREPSDAANPGGSRRWCKECIRKADGTHVR